MNRHPVIFEHPCHGCGGPGENCSHCGGRGWVLSEEGMRFMEFMRFHLTEGRLAGLLTEPSPEEQRALAARMIEVEKSRRAKED